MDRAEASENAQRGFVEALIGDGRPLLMLSGLVLIFSGLFALFLSVTKQFLPHDVQYFGMTAEQLCLLHGCRTVHFIFHDRVAFGGAIIAVGVIYLWQVLGCVWRGQPSRSLWQALAVGGVAGFA